MQTHKVYGGDHLSDSRAVVVVLVAMTVACIATIFAGQAGTREIDPVPQPLKPRRYVVGVVLGLLSAVMTLVSAVASVDGWAWPTWASLAIMLAVGLALGIVFYRMTKFWPLMIPIAAYAAVLILLGGILLLGWGLSSATLQIDVG